MLFFFVCPYRLQFFFEGITTGSDALAHSDLLSDNFQPSRNIGKLRLDRFLFFTAYPAGFGVKLLSLKEQKPKPIRSKKALLERFKTRLNENLTEQKNHMTPTQNRDRTPRKGR